jgi:PAS domain S-box-containing protein
VEEFGQGVYDESGGVVAVEGLIYDVTEREQAEERLREAEERYRTLVERVPAIVYVQEPGEPSRTTYVSPQNEAILGYSPEECIADPDHWIKIMHPDDRERVLAEDRRTNDCGDSFATEYRQFARDGRLVWLRDEATLVRGEGESRSTGSGYRPTSPSARRPRRPCAGARSGFGASPTRPSRASSSATREKSWRPTAR